MNWGTPANAIHAWWNQVPGERFWLDATERDGRDTLLAAPRGEGALANSSTHRLITHVRGGDVVFHFDAPQGAIVACSSACGRIGKHRLTWPSPAGSSDGEATHRMLPCWGIGLRDATRLATPVPLTEIAGVQWNLFDSLRALEDEVGDPLYYPFEMGNRTATRALSGYVFKLPALFVASFPELASAATRHGRPLAARTLAPARAASPAMASVLTSR